MWKVRLWFLLQLEVLALHIDWNVSHLAAHEAHWQDNRVSGFTSWYRPGNSYIRMSATARKKSNDKIDKKRTNRGWQEYQVYRKKQSTEVSNVDTTCLSAADTFLWALDVAGTDIKTGGNLQIATPLDVRTGLGTVGIDINVEIPSVDIEGTDLAGLFFQAIGLGAYMDAAMFVYSAVDVAISVAGGLVDEHNWVAAHNDHEKAKSGQDKPGSSPREKFSQELALARSTCYMKYKGISTGLSIVTTILDVATAACNFIAPGAGVLSYFAWRLILVPIKFFFDWWAKKKTEKCMEKAFKDLRDSFKEKGKPQPTEESAYVAVEGEEDKILGDDLFKKLSDPSEGPTVTKEQATSVVEALPDDVESAVADLFEVTLTSDNEEREWGGVILDEEPTNVVQIWKDDPIVTATKQAATELLGGSTDTTWVKDESLDKTFQTSFRKKMETSMKETWEDKLKKYKAESSNWVMPDTQELQKMLAVSDDWKVRKCIRDVLMNPAMARISPKTQDAFCKARKLISAVKKISK